MIGNCFNRDCNEELRYLRQGSVYQLDTCIGQKDRSEFFWLCPACSRTFKLVSDRTGLPVLAPCNARPDCPQRSSRVRQVLRGVTQERSLVRIECREARRNPCAAPLKGTVHAMLSKY